MASSGLQDFGEQAFRCHREQVPGEHTVGEQAHGGQAFCYPGGQELGEQAFGKQTFGEKAPGRQAFCYPGGQELGEQALGGFSCCQVCCQVSCPGSQ